MGEYERLSPDETEIVLPAEQMALRSTKFTEASFVDASMMVYEKSNRFALSYFGISRNEQSLLLSGLVSAHNINRMNPYTEEEKQAGIQCYVPIKHVARMMGYNIEDKNKTFYKAVRNAAAKLTSSKSLMLENDDHTGFSVFNIISQVDYNKDNDGMVAFKFSPGASELFLDNKSNFTLYSLILANKMRKIGKSGAVSLHEVLRTEFYKAERSEKGYVEVYYDFIDFKCKLFLVNTNVNTVRKILENPRYHLDLLKNNDALAYERALSIESLDVSTKEAIRKIRSSEEYKKISAYKKSPEYKRAIADLKKMQVGTEEYEALYQSKVKAVTDLDHRLQMLENSIICQYTDWSDFRRRVLIPSQKAFLEAIRDTNLMDMMFEYKPYSYKGKVIGIHFTVYTVEAYKKKEKEQGVQISLFEYLKERGYDEYNPMEASVYDEIGGAEKVATKKKKKKEKVEVTLGKIEQYIRENPVMKESLSATDMFALAKLADFEVFKEKYDMMKDNVGEIKNPVAWLTSAIKNDYRPAASNVSTTYGSKQGNYNSFHNFEQREYDFDAIEQELLSNK